MTTTTSHDLEFLEDVQAELIRARKKFPSPELSALALMEEVGEVAKAIIQEDRARVRAECIQVACMALRVALEGDPSTDHFRKSIGLEVI